MAYKVTLGHAPNPDIAGGYWEEPVDARKALTVEVATFAEASALCRPYIERNHLGAGNWAGGKITAAGKVCIPKTLSGMTRGWVYGNKAADGRVSDPAAACYPVVVRATRAT